MSTEAPSQNGEKGNGSGADATDERQQAPPADPPVDPANQNGEKTRSQNKSKQTPSEAESESSSDDSSSDSDSSNDSDDGSSKAKRKKKKKKSKKADKKLLKMLKNKDGALLFLSAADKGNHKEAKEFIEDFISRFPDRKDRRFDSVKVEFLKRFSHEKRSRKPKDGHSKRARHDPSSASAKTETRPRNDHAAATARDPNERLNITVDGQQLTRIQWEMAKKHGLCIRCWEKGHRANDSKKCKKHPDYKGDAAMEVDEKKP